MQEAYEFDLKRSASFVYTYVKGHLSKFVIVFYCLEYKGNN